MEEEVLEKEIERPLENATMIVWRPRGENWPRYHSKTKHPRGNFFTLNLNKST